MQIAITQAYLNQLKGFRRLIKPEKCPQSELFFSVGSTSTGADAEVVEGMRLSSETTTTGTTGFAVFGAGGAFVFASTGV